jgi:hypothetical protein
VGVVILLVPVDLPTSSSCSCSCLSFLSPSSLLPVSTLQAVAHGSGSGCCCGCGCGCGVLDPWGGLSYRPHSLFIICRRGPSYPVFHPQSTPRAVAREAGAGGVSSVSFMVGPHPLRSPVGPLFVIPLLFPPVVVPRRSRCSTCDPPHEQLLVRLGQVVCRPCRSWSVLIPFIPLSVPCSSFPCRSPVRRSPVVPPCRCPASFLLFHP